MYSRSNKHRHAVSPSEITSLDVPVHVPEVLNTETADWIPFRGSLSFFFSLLFHSVNNHLPMKLATLPSVFVCVCVCVREREIERRCIFGHVFALVPTDKVGFVSQKYVSERERSLRE